MPTLESLRVTDPVLTQIAIGYTNEDFVGTLLFPIVENQKKGGKYVEFGKEAFKIYETQRAPRSRSNRIDWAATSKSLNLEEQSLEIPVDFSEFEEATDPIEPEQDATWTVTEAMRLKLEKTQADLAQDANQYGANNKKTLSGTAQWSDLTNSDPIGDVQDAREAIRSAIGRYPNTMIMGPLVFKALQKHSQILERIKYSMKGIITTDILAQIFELKKVAVGAGVYADYQGTFYDLWGKKVIIAYVPEPQNGRNNKFRPSFGYTFRQQGRPKVRKYVDEPFKSEIIEVEDVWDVKITAAGAGYLIIDAVA